MDISGRFLNVLGVWRIYPSILGYIFNKFILVLYTFLTLFRFYIYIYSIAGVITLENAYILHKTV